MDLFTIGREFYKGLVVHLKYLDNENCITDENYKKGFSLFLIEEGSGILKINDAKVRFISPSVFCINENELIKLEKSISIKARSIYFSPDVINSLLNFENIRNKDFPEDFITASQDVFSLNPFLIRDENYNGYFTIGPFTLKRINHLFDCINKELDEQRDTDWPCRSRSYFLETLFLLQKAQSEEDTLSNTTFTSISTDENIIDDVILYLYTHYQHKITISDLTEIFHINRTSLMVKFQKATGMTIISYLTKLRINVAALLLKDTFLPVSEVIDRVGFNDITHFGRMFKKYIGTSPTEYRQKYSWAIYA